MVNTIYWKKKYVHLLFAFVFLSLAFLNKANGQAVNVQWPLTLWEVPTITGNVNAANQLGSSGIGAISYWTSGSYSTGWNSTSRNTSDYYEYSLIPYSGLSLTVTSVSFSHSVNSGTMMAAAYYSTDGFATTTRLGTSDVSVSTTENTVTFSGLSVNITNGKTFAVRIYGWAAASSATEYRNRDVTIIGTTSCTSVAVTASASSSSVCSGETINLSSTGPSGSTGAVLLSENFNSATNNWAKVNQSSGGVIDDAAWLLRPDGYYYYFDFHSNDNSQFYISNSHSQGTSSSTVTMLQSPVISTVGYSTLSMEFFHYFDSFRGDVGRVQVSTDNVNWKDVAFFTTPQGSASAFARYSVNLDAYVGKSTLWVRFRYTASWGWWWAIDNVTIGSLSSSYTINWSSSPAGYTSTVQNPQGVTPTQTTTYTVEYKSGSGCSGSASTTVTVSQGTTAPTAPAEQNFCKAVTIADLEATAPAGSTVRWFTVATGGTPIDPSTVLSTRTYYAESFNSSSCFSQTRTPVSVNVNAVPAQPPVITGETAVCPGAALTYSVTNVPGVTYNWSFPSGWTQTGGGTTSTVAVTAGNTPGDIVVTPSNSCGSGAAQRLAVKLATPVVPAITVSADLNPSCSGQTVLFTAVATNGGTSPGYQWKVNGSAITGATASTYSFKPASGDLVSCTLTSSELCASPKSAESNLISMELKPSVVPSVTISASQNPICDGAEVIFTATYTNAGTTPVRQWKVNGVNAGSDSDTFRFVPKAGDVVTCEVTSSDSCSNPATAISNSVVMQVDPSAEPEIVITADQDPVCEGNNVNFTSIVNNAGTNPVYQWIVNGTDITSATSASYAYIPKANDVVECRLISSDPCSGSDPVLSNKITIVFGTSLAPSITISTPRMPVCPNEPVTFTSLVTNGGTTPSFQWVVNGASVAGAVSGSYTFIPDNGDEVICEMTSNLPCVTATKVSSNLIRVSVSPSIVPVINIVADKAEICEGEMVRYTSSITNGGSSPIYQWRLNGTVIAGATQSSLNYSPKSGDAITCRLTSSESCAQPLSASSNSIKITVNKVLVPAITIVSDQNEVCSGTVITYSSNITNGGSNPVYQWIVNGNPVDGATNATYSYVASNGDVVSCRLTSNALCANPAVVNSNSITMVLGPPIFPSITITADNNPVCPGEEITFSSVTAYGGPTPTYRWIVNGLERISSVPGSLTYTPTNGDVVSCEFVSSLDCAEPQVVSSNSITVTHSLSTTPVIMISADQESVCAGTRVNITADITNGGPNPTIQWKVNGSNVGGNINTFSYIPNDEDVITCQLISDDPCANPKEVSSSEITFQVENKLTPTIRIVADQNEVCTGAIITYSSSITNGGSDPAYQWIVNGNAVVGATNATYSFAAVNGDVVTCQLISNAACASPVTVVSNSITMIMGPPIFPSIVISASQNPVCPGAEVTFTSVTRYGGSTPTYRWLVNGVERSSLVPGMLTYAPEDGDVVACDFTSSLDCAEPQVVSSNVITITHNASLVLSVDISADQETICAGSAVSFTAEIVNGGTAPSYQWQVNEVDYPGANEATFNYNEPRDGDVVRCQVVSNDPCVAIVNAVSENIILEVVNELTPSVEITADRTEICEGETVTFSSVSTNEGATPGYQWLVNGAVIAGETSGSLSYAVKPGDEVTCLLVSSAPCADPVSVSSNSLGITVTELVVPSITIAESQNPVCAGTLVTFTAEALNGGDAPLYSWRVNGIIVAGETEETFTYSPVDGEVVSCGMVSSVSCPVVPSVLSNSITMSVNQPVMPEIMISVDRNPVCSGTEALFTASVINGGITPAYQWKVNDAPVLAATAAQFTYTPAEGDIITCDLLFNEACLSETVMTSNSIVMGYKKEVLPVINILPVQNPVCPGLPISFVSSVTNGGTTPSYQWKVNGTNISGATAGSFSRALNNGDVVTCEYTSTIECVGQINVISNSVIVELKPVLIPVISIASDNNPMCEGAIVNFTSNVTNAGQGPLYQWIINGTLLPISASPVYSYVPEDGDQVSCELISNDPCAGLSVVQSNVIVFDLNPTVEPLVTISSYREPACPGSPATFVAVATNSGSSPAFRWLVNDLPVSGEFNDTFIYTPVDGDRVACILTSSNPCANPVTVQSNELTMSIRDDHGPQLTCPPDFTDVPVDQGQCFATILSLGEPDAVDDCGSVTVVNDASAQFPIGITTVIWTATDLAGNQTTCSQRVTVIDDQPPVITCPPDLSLLTDGAFASYLENVDLGAPMVSDNCEVLDPINDAPERFPLGITTVTWSIADASGNISSCPQQVAVIQPLVAIAGNDTIIGSCDTLKLDGRRSSGPIELYSWSLLSEGGQLTGQTEDQASFSLAPGYDLLLLPHDFTVLLQVVGEQGQLDSDTLTVRVDQAPEAVAVQSGDPNNAGRLILDATSSKGTNLSFIWTTTNGQIEGGPDGALITVSRSGNYSLWVSDRYGCSSSASLEVDITEPLLIANDDYVRTAWTDTVRIRVLDNDFDSFNGIDTTSLKIVDEPELGTVRFDQDGSVIYTPVSSATGLDNFRYRICNYGNLCDTAQVTINLVESLIIIPEGLSPNGDGLNDQFVIESLVRYPGSRLAIYTRAGQMVFRSNDYQNDWDGHVSVNGNRKGPLVPQGIYYYTLKLGGTTRKIRGFIFIAY